MYIRVLGGTSKKHQGYPLWILFVDNINSGFSTHADKTLPNPKSLRHAIAIIKSRYKVKRIKPTVVSDTYGVYFELLENIDLRSDPRVRRW